LGSDHYTINAHLPLPDPVAREGSVGRLLAILTGSRRASRPGENWRMIAACCRRRANRARVVGE
jgi:hypothetical protein